MRILLVRSLIFALLAVALASSQSSATTLTYDFSSVSPLSETLIISGFDVGTPTGINAGVPFWLGTLGASVLSGGNYVGTQSPDPLNGPFFGYFLQASANSAVVESCGFSQ